MVYAVSSFVVAAVRPLPCASYRLTASSFPRSYGKILASMGKEHRSEHFKRKEVPKENKAKSLPSDPNLCKAFELYRSELDHKHDKYERLVKVSRDLTIVSKRIIFQLHRTSSIDDDDESAKEIKSKLLECDELIGKICDEVAIEDPHKFHKAFSPGLQEFVEAVSFLHLKNEGSILSYEDLCTRYARKEKDNKCFLTEMDYVLGIGDLTGELMRLSINSIGAGEHQKAYSLCNIIRTVYDSLVMFHVPGSEFGRKLNTMHESLKKVERACYQIHVRGKEAPNYTLLDLALSDHTDGFKVADQS